MNGDEMKGEKNEKNTLGNEKNSAFEHTLKEDLVMKDTLINLI